MLRPTLPPSTGPLSARNRIALVAALCACLLLTGLSPATGQTDADAIREQLEAVEAEQAQLQRSLTTATERVDDLTARLAEIRDRSAQLNAELDALRQRGSRAQALTDRRIRRMYKGGRVNTMMAFATGTSVTDISTRTHYLTAMTRRSQQEFERAASLYRATQAREQELAGVNQRVDELVAEAADAQADLNAQFAVAGQTHNQLEEDLAAAEAEALRLAQEAEAKRRAAEAAEAASEDAARQVAEAEAAERRAAAASRSADRARAAVASAPQPAPQPEPEPAPESGSSGGGGGGSSGGGGGSTAPTSGGKACPQDNPRSYSDTWGAPRSGGRTHQGTDIFGAYGGDVFAIVDGTIEWTRTGGTSGLFLSLRGNDGNTYWYMHMIDFTVSAGQSVQAGDLIAHNGDTGNAQGTTPHIHFEYHPGGGGAVNPYPLVKSVCG